ncbi:MAG: hypothetical protein IPI11_16690 [Haliscomenobacter sp.]|nr:hypothetical protein [Haliscomenobacter sp.]
MKKYFIYAIGEILLIMIGILLALKVNTMQENQIKRSDELTVYKTIRDQIKNYKAILEKDFYFNKSYMAQFEYAHSIIERNDRTQTDTLGKIASQLINFSDFDGTGDIYETIVHSGEVKLLGNAAIVDEVRKLEEQFLLINRSETIHYEFIRTYVVSSLKNNVQFETGRLQNPEALFETEFQNIILISLKIMGEKDEAYHTAIRDITPHCAFDQ